MVQKGITILGTGGDSVVVGRQMRASGGFIIVTDNTQLHFDPGPGTLVQLAKNEYHPRETTCIILSHQHVNHANDANALISAMTHNGIDKRGVLITNTLDHSAVSAYHQTLLEKVVVLEPGKRVGINDVEIHAVALEHYDTQSVGYIVHTPDYILGYIADTKYFPELPDLYRDCNLLIINCTNPDSLKEGDHLNTEDCVDIINTVKPQLAVLTHFGAKMLTADPLAQARAIYQEVKTQVVAAKDGLHISPATYSVKKSQQTLKKY